MAANTQPLFTGTPRRPEVRNPTANTNRDGATGTYTTLCTAGANGSYFSVFRSIYDTAPSAGDVIRLFYIQNGGTLYLMHEIIVPATTPATSAANAPPTQTMPIVEWTGPGEVRDKAGNLVQAGVGFVMGASDIIKVTTDQGKGNICSLEGGGDY